MKKTYAQRWGSDRKRQAHKSTNTKAQRRAKVAYDTIQSKITELETGIRKEQELLKNPKTWPKYLKKEDIVSSIELYNKVISEKKEEMNKLIKKHGKFLEMENEAVNIER